MSTGIIASFSVLIKNKHFVLGKRRMNSIIFILFLRFTILVFWERVIFIFKMLCRQTVVTKIEFKLIEPNHPKIRIVSCQLN